MQCKVCTYWRDSECRRHPPSLVPIQSAVPVSNILQPGQAAQSGLKTVGIYPPIGPEAGCGDGEIRVDAEQSEIRKLMALGVVDKQGNVNLKVLLRKLSPMSIVNNAQYCEAKASVALDGDTQVYIPED